MLEFSMRVFSFPHLSYLNDNRRPSLYSIHSEVNNRESSNLRARSGVGRVLCDFAQPQLLRSRYQHGAAISGGAYDEVHVAFFVDADSGAVFDPAGVDGGDGCHGAGG